MQFSGMEARDCGGLGHESISFVAYIHNPSSTTYSTDIHSRETWFYWNGGTINNGGTSMNNQSTTASTSIQIIFNSGNVETGEFYLYGMNKS